MLRELNEKRSVFGLRAAGFYRGDVHRNFTVSIHDTPAVSPLGAAAGPHTQLAPNIVLDWLAGARVIELRTVHAVAGAVCPRPSIDAGTVGFHLERGHELTMEEALEEYVKASMLIDILCAGNGLRTLPGFEPVYFDLGLGLELKDIRGERVGAFIEAMRDARGVVDSLRPEIPEDYKGFRDLDFTTRLVSSVTLTVGPGPKPDELESVLVHLLEERRLHCFVKFSPTLLGHDDSLQLLHKKLGYSDLALHTEAFADHLLWDEAAGIMDRVGDKAAAVGRMVGAKFAGGMPVQNRNLALSPERPDADLTGPPLHLLAMELVRRFRRQFKDRFPISFSGGIHRANFPDAVALGLAPVSVCSDLLKPGGYGRLGAYHRDLAKRMAAVGADNVDDFILAAYGMAEETLMGLGLHEASRSRKNCLDALQDGGDLRRAAGTELFDRWVSEAKLRNTERYVAQLFEGNDYAKEHHSEPPEKVNSELSLFDCLTCEECIAVCPNRAAFSVSLTEPTIPAETVVETDWGWEWNRDWGRQLKANRQIAIFADHCNACGNCDVVCPERGAPHLRKAFLFGSLSDFVRDSQRDGFFISLHRVYARIDGEEYRMDLDEEWVTYSGDGFQIRFNEMKPEVTTSGQATAKVDMTPYHIMRILQMGVFHSTAVNYLNTRAATRETAHSRTKK
jgi:putative selenate reductase